MLKHQHELTADEKRQQARRADGLRAVDRMAMAAQAMLEDREDDALQMAGDARAMLRKALHPGRPNGKH